jgi:putative peptide zinc metalloprotease protein
MTMVADVPARPDGLELIGEVVGSGYRNPPSLVRRQDGQTLQLTPLLYAILEATNGHRSYAAIAQHVSERTGRTMSAADVEALVERQLRPRGLLLGRDGTEPPLERSNPLTGLRLKLAITDPTLTRRLTDPFRALFHPLVWVPLLLVFVWVTWWLLMDRGLASAVYHAFAKPDLMALVLVVTLLSAGFHEFGHAAAARRGGALPGVMGAGWFLLWPAFFTDVTDTYRLGRTGRLRTDLGGLYFNAIIAVAIAAIWWISGWDALLLVIAAQILQMIRQLAPLVRFDGYHVLADVTGVPDLFSRIGPILSSFWPGRWNDPRVAQLKWWVRLIVTAWVLIVLPLLLLSLLALVLAAPRLIGSAMEAIGREWVRLGINWDAGRLLDTVGGMLAMAIIALPIVAMAVVFARLAVGFVTGLWRRTEGRPVRRGAAGALVLLLSATLVYAWWPDPDRYEPVRPYEDGTLLSVATVPLAAIGYQAPPSRSDAGGEIITVLPESGSLPTEEEPALALVLVPTKGAGAAGAADAGDGASGTGTPATADPAWVFPFNEPLPPEPGDNQAVAVNTTDGGVTYDVAVAMVWVTGEEPVLNQNEAYAFASCSDCVTVAVAFQIVVIVGSANVIVPQNLSAAVNYECFECITASIASQLVVTVDSLPDAEQQIALTDIWDEILAFAASIPTLTLADVIAQLEDYKDEIVAILGVAPSMTPSPAASGSSAVSPTPSPAAGASEGATETAEPIVTPPPPPPTASPPETASPEPTPATTPTPSSEWTPEPTETPSPS